MSLVLGMCTTRVSFASHLVTSSLVSENREALRRWTDHVVAAVAA